jgi:DNA mismatch endonuclease (patch repair protein)
MVDRVSAERRSFIMSRVHQKDTKPEVIVRKLIYGLGYRYRLHCKDLPGKPDIVFKSRHKVIFIHGCFWHNHKGCLKGRLPKSRIEYWQAKIANNVKRDEKVNRELGNLHWKYMTIWQCEIKDRENLIKRIVDFLKD